VCEARALVHLFVSNGKKPWGVINLCT
jgi:hypothetical protein